MRGDAEGAKNQLVVNTNLSWQEIDRVVAGLSAKTEEAKARAKQIADKAADYSAGALWVVFFGGLLGLAAAALGGSAGSKRLVTSCRRFDHI